MNRDQARARAKELGIKNVSSHTKDELLALIESAEMAIQLSPPEPSSALALAPAPKGDILLNRKDIRARGGITGYYRMPRRSASAKTGSAGHWLARVKDGTYIPPEPPRGARKGGRKAAQLRILEAIAALEDNE